MAGEEAKDGSFLHCSAAQPLERRDAWLKFPALDPRIPSSPARNLFLVISCSKPYSCRRSFRERGPSCGALSPHRGPSIRLGCFAPKNSRFSSNNPCLGRCKGLSPVRWKIAPQLAKGTESRQQGKGEDFKAAPLPPPLLLVQSSPPPSGFASRRLAGCNGSCPTRQPPEITCFSHHVRAMRPPATPLQWRKICSS